MAWDELAETEQFALGNFLLQLFGSDIHWPEDCVLAALDCMAEIGFSEALRWPSPRMEKPGESLLGAREHLMYDRFRGSFFRS
jgi:hypothetical protein